MKRIYKIAILALALMQFGQIFIRVDFAPAIFIAAAIIGLIGIKLLGKSFRIITIVFFVMGLGLLILYRQPFTIWMSSFGYMTKLISILVVMQLFTIPIETGKYNLALQHMLKKICNKESRLFLFTMFITHVFSCFLSMGAVPIVMTLMRDTIQDQVPDYKRFTATAVSRGFTLGTLWAPGAATIFLIGQITQIGWPTLFFPSLFLAFAGIAVSYFLELKQHHISTIVSKPELETDMLLEHEEKVLQNKVWHIVGAVVTLIALTMLFIQLNISTSASAVILSGVIVVSVWILLLIKEPGLKNAAKNYWDSAIFKAADIAPFFVAIGVFSGGFQNSGIDRYLEQGLQASAGSIGLIAIVLIPIIIIVLALIGLHPLVSIALLGQIVMTIHLPLPALTIALCLNLGGSVAYMVSPFAGIIMLIAKFINTKATDIAIRWNWLFCTLYFVLGILMAYCFERILT